VTGERAEREQQHGERDPRREQRLHADPVEQRECQPL